MIKFIRRSKHLIGVILVLSALFAWPLIYNYCLVFLKDAHVVSEKDFVATVSSDEAIQLQAIMSYVTINAMRVAFETDYKVDSFELCGSEFPGIVIDLDADYLRCRKSGPIYYWNNNDYFLQSERSYVVEFIKNNVITKQIVVPSVDYRKELESSKFCDVNSIGNEYVRWIIAQITEGNNHMLKADDIYHILERCSVNISKDKYEIKDENEAGKGHIKSLINYKTLKYSRFHNAEIIIYKKEDTTIPLGGILVLTNAPSEKLSIFDYLTNAYEWLKELLK